MARRPRGVVEIPDFEPPGGWARRASCKGMPMALLDFFGALREQWGSAKQVCKGCPVKKECLAYALETRAVHGVWGGLDQLELRFVQGRDASGAVWTYDKTDVKCPVCRHATVSVELTDMLALRKCEACGFTWERGERRRPKRRRRTATPVMKEAS